MRKQKENILYANFKKIQEYKRIIMQLISLLEKEWIKNGGMPICAQNIWEKSCKAVGREQNFCVQEKSK